MKVGKIVFLMSICFTMCDINLCAEYAMIFVKYSKLETSTSITPQSRNLFWVAVSHTLLLFLLLLVRYLYHDL